MVIPAFNEVRIIRKNARMVIDAMRKRGYDFELIVAEDGSTDGTDVAARQLAREIPELRHLHFERRLGKGLALKRALLDGRGDILMFMDADLATSLQHLPELVDAVLGGSDVVIGSRYIKGSKLKMPTNRFVVAQIYNYLIRLLFQDGIRDHQCGFKAFRRDALMDILEEVEDNWFFFDTELLIRAKKMGYKVSELPVDWREPRERISTFRLFRDGLRMGGKLFWLRIKLWWARIRGKARRRRRTV